MGRGPRDNQINPPAEPSIGGGGFEIVCWVANETQQRGILKCLGSNSYSLETTSGQQSLTAAELLNLGIVPCPPSGSGQISQPEEEKTAIGAITDTDSPYCGQTLFVNASGEKCVFDTQQGQWVTLQGDDALSVTAVNWQGDQDQVVGQIAKFEVPASTTSTAQDQVAAAIAAEAPTGVINGKEYTFTIDDVLSYEVRMTGNCPVGVCGQDRVVYSDGKDGGVTLDGTIDIVTTETPAEITVCFAKDLSKTEIAALPDAP